MRPETHKFADLNGRIEQTWLLVLLERPPLERRPRRSQRTPH